MINDESYVFFHFSGDSSTEEIQFTVQGDHSGCCLGYVDIKTKVAFQYRLLILRNMQLLR